MSEFVEGVKYLLIVYGGFLSNENTVKTRCEISVEYRIIE